MGSLPGCVGLLHRNGFSDPGQGRLSGNWAALGAVCRMVVSQHSDANNSCRRMPTMTTLHFGRGSIDVAIAAERLVAVERRPPSPPVADPAAEVRNAIEAPLG